MAPRAATSLRPTRVAPINDWFAFLNPSAPNSVGRQSRQSYKGNHFTRMRFSWKRPGIPGSTVRDLGRDRNGHCAYIMALEPMYSPSTYGVHLLGVPSSTPSDRCRRHHRGYGHCQGLCSWRMLRRSRVPKMRELMRPPGT
ncbi:hypothetical protein VTN31DRAFT_5423 [Thermomyces dupontii]|uniref:uncharacterized protein n=1 Tax=Talaromyces thermophilus TaxID=28565 RepID=UPI003744A6D4